MNITFIVGHLAKERHSLLYELALDLAKNNKNGRVTVITGFPSRRISAEAKKYYLKNSHEVINCNLEIIRVGSKRGEGNNLFVRMIKYIFLTYSLFKKAKKIKTDVYYIYSTPPFLGLLNNKLSKIAPVLYNAQDLFPDTLIRVKKYSEKNILVKFLRVLERKVYEGCTKVVTISNDMKHTLISHGVDRNKIDVISNWVDIDKILNVNRANNELFDIFQLPRSEFYVSYAGDVGLFQKWDLIINVAQILEEEYPNIQFIIIGNGSYKNKLVNEIKRRGITNVKIFPLQPIKYISSAYSLGDIEFVSLENGVTKIALPSKIGQIMSVGRPILGLFDYGSDIAKTINCNNLGVVPEKLLPSNIAFEIIALYKNQQILRVMSDNCRAYAENNFNRQMQTKKYYDLLHEIKKYEE